MHRYLKWLPVVAAVASISVHAEGLKTNVEVSRLGVHEGVAFYMTLRGEDIPECSGRLYCSTDKESCKSMFTIALSAKLAGKPLGEVRYEKDVVKNSCFIQLVAIDS